jgi:hypothetical protein
MGRIAAHHNNTARGAVRVQSDFQVYQGNPLRNSGQESCWKPVPSGV